MTADAKGMSAEDIAMSKVRMFCLDMATKNGAFHNDKELTVPKTSSMILEDAQNYFNFITGKEA